MKTPSANGANRERDSKGRFTKGNPGGPGNPHAQRTAQLRALLLDCVKDTDFKKVIAKLLAMAKDGDLAAIRELLDRMMGKPKSTIELEQTEIGSEELDREIEEALEELVERRIRGLLNRMKGRPESGVKSNRAEEDGIYPEFEAAVEELVEMRIAERR